MTSLPIIFPSGVNAIVAVNEKVQIGQVIARKTSYKEFIIDASSIFSEPPEKVRKMLRKKPGDFVKAGEAVAVKKSFFGLREKKLVSKVSGLFLRYERTSGKVVIAVENTAIYEDILSPVEGVVTMCDNEKIVIDTEKDVYSGRKGVGGSTTSEIFILKEAFENIDNTTPTNEISIYYSLDSNAVGKIVIGRDFPRDIIIKCIGIGAAGIVGTEIRNEDIDYLAQRKMDVPIIEVDSLTIEKIKKWKGKRFYLNSQEKKIIVLHV